MGRHPATDRVVLRYGLHLYQRSATIWQVYIKLKKRDPIRKSLWTDDLTEAKELAWQEYTDAKERLVSRTRFPWTQNWLNRSVQGGPEHDRQF